jgi:hypothetical protein
VKPSLRTSALLLAIAVLCAGCFFRRPESPAFDGCWNDGATTGYIVGTAANTIIGGGGARGPRIRSLAGVPLVVDSIRAHSQVVSDPAICKRFWDALESEARDSRLAVVQIGHTYWVRSRGGIRAFDDRARLLAAIVDL